jgi:hypothetical protein
MSQATNARTAAMEALIEAHATELKLPTVRQRFRALADEATREQQTPIAYLAALLSPDLSARVSRVGRWRPAWPVGSRAGDGLTH